MLTTITSGQWIKCFVTAMKLKLLTLSKAACLKPASAGSGRRSCRNSSSKSLTGTKPSNTLRTFSWHCWRLIQTSTPKPEACKRKSCQNGRAGQTHRAVVMSVLDQFGDDRRSILEVALEQPTPNRISKAWVCHRIEEVIGRHSAPC